MIHIKTEKELEKMRVAGRLTAIARKAAADAVKPGVTTWEIDRIVRKTIEDAGAKPSFLGSSAAVFGRWLDRYGSRTVLTWNLILLGVVVVWMSTVTSPRCLRISMSERPAWLSFVSM